jgi:hypothetical protein
MLVIQKEPELNRSRWQPINPAGHCIHTKHLEGAGRLPHPEKAQSCCIPSYTHADDLKSAGRLPRPERLREQSTTCHKAADIALEGFERPPICRVLDQRLEARGQL